MARKRKPAAQKTEELPAAPAAASPVTHETTFEGLGLDSRILEKLKELKWEKPTPIQAQAIPVALKGDDLIGVAQTGTGKTAAFLLPIAQILGEPTGSIRALILLPTRELALQVADTLDKFGPLFGLRHVVIYGGAPIGLQRLKLREGVDILVATPGRLLDMMNHVLIQWGQLKFLVLDEADRMLDMGFQPDVEAIMRKLPMARQTMLFTATMEPQISQLAKHHMLYPKEITIGYNRTVAPGITQWIYSVKRPQKNKLLLQMFDELDIESAIIFCGTKLRTDQLGKELQKRGHEVGILHADRAQSEREKTLARFRAGEIRYLVATDVASRGLDITGVTHVVNYDVPSSPDDYIHRVGRTARAEAKGDAITFVAPEEEKGLAAIEKLLGYKLERSVLADFPRRGAAPKKIVPPPEEEVMQEEAAPEAVSEETVQERTAEGAGAEKSAEERSPRRRRRRRRGGERGDKRDGAAPAPAEIAASADVPDTDAETEPEDDVANRFDEPEEPEPEAEVKKEEPRRQRDNRRDDRRGRRREDSGEIAGTPPPLGDDPGPGYQRGRDKHAPLVFPVTTAFSQKSREKQDFHKLREERERQIDFIRSNERAKNKW